MDREKIATNCAIRWKHCLQCDAAQPCSGCRYMHIAACTSTHAEQMLWEVVGNRRLVNVHSAAVTYSRETRNTPTLKPGNQQHPTSEAGGSKHHHQSQQQLPYWLHALGCRLTLCRAQVIAKHMLYASCPKFVLIILVRWLHSGPINTKRPVSAGLSPARCR